MIGCIQVIKTFILSQFLYVMSAITVPEKYVSEINMMMWSYIWQNKRSKIKSSIMCKPKEKGGLNAPDFQEMVAVSNIRWMKKYVVSQESYWALFFKYFLSKVIIDLEMLYVCRL